MKNLILYASKKGFTQKCALILQEHMGKETDILEINKNNPAPEWDLYQKVIIGGPIYAGKGLKPLMDFLTQWETQLLKKQLGIFVVSLSDKEVAGQYFKTLFSQNIQDQAVVRGAFGGAINRASLSWIERTLLGFMGIRQDVSNLNMNEILNVAQKMKEA